MSWAEGRGKITRAWKVPFFAVEWSFEWVAYFLSHWKFLEVLEYLGSFGVLVAVIFYFSESGDRTKQKHYQAWQVVNTAQGKGGSGGRLDALQELNRDGVPLVGVDASGAFLQGIRLPDAHLLRSNFSAADLRDSDFESTDFTDADLHSANFRGSGLRKANLSGADLSDTDLTGADLAETDLSRADLYNADLHEANLENIRWREIQSVKNAQIQDVKNAPPGFIEWALQHGAVENGDEDSGAPSQK